MQTAPDPAENKNKAKTADFQAQLEKKASCHKLIVK